jgi:hypothetical protein
MKNPHWFNRSKSILSYWRLALGGTFLCTGLALAFVASSTMTTPVGAASAQSAGFYTGKIALSGTSSPQSGEFTPSGENDVTQAEYPGQADNEDGSPGPVPPFIVNRSLSKGVGKGVAAAVGKKAKSNPQLNFSFAGLNLYQQRYARGGNQFTVEPPDQGMCVGNGYVVEAVNDVLNVFNTSGVSQLPDNTSTNIVSGFSRNVNHAIDLNSFFGYPPAINRTTGARGEFVTDPSCLYDSATKRFFVIALTLDPQVPGPCQGVFSCVNHLDIAVSQTSDPTGAWNIYRVNVTNDGTDTGGSGANVGPYLGDYPHIGADANGFYVTTNAYPWFGNGFSGAQIYAFSKAQLAAGAASVNMAHIDTSGLVNAPSDAGSTQPGFTVWPAQSPGTTSFNLNNGGTEYFLSSNAADEATHPVAGTGGNYTSNQIVLWTLTNTASLNTSPALSLSNKLVTVSQYAIPPAQVQPGSGTTADKTTTPDVAQGACLNDATTLLFNGAVGCWNLLVSPTAHAAGTEVISRPDANDTRMQQVMYANGKIWGALDTAVSFDNNPNRAGIAWYVLNPNGNIAKQGTYGIPAASLTYPAIGVTAAGRGVMAFSYTDDATTNPSAAYAPIDASLGVGDTHIITTGHARDDGFTGYKQQRFPLGIRPRWGDYGATAVDGNSVWIASEFTQSADCNYTDWGGPFFAGGTGDNLLGTCGGASHGPGTRTALGNWNTRISKLTP